MAEATYRSFRFVFPEWAGAAGTPSSGLQIDPTGGTEMVEGHDAVRQAILMLLATAPGERLLRPDYGCRIHWLAFAPNEETTAGLVIHYVGQALRRWEPRIDVLDLHARPDPQDPATIVIGITYRLKATQQLSQLEYPFRLPGEEV
jgi:hypothetical protein